MRLHVLQQLGLVPGDVITAVTNLVARTQLGDIASVHFQAKAGEVPVTEGRVTRGSYALDDRSRTLTIEVFLNNPSGVNPFYLIASDGNLLPHPIQVQSVRIGPAERVDVIIDFSKFRGQTLYLENRLNQLNG